MSDVDTIVVHALVVDEVQHNSVSLLDVGRELVRNAVEQGAWFSVRENLDTSIFRPSNLFCLGRRVADGPREQTGSRGRSYDYALPLPALDREKREPITYPEWGWPQHTSDPAFCLRDLEEFESTKLDDLFVPRVSNKASKHPRPVSEASHTASKRRKLDTSAPLDIIPKVSRPSLQIAYQHVNLPVNSHTTTQPD